GILMDQTNVIAGTAWSTPVTVKELQHFVKIANFYQCFNQANLLMPSLSGSLLHTFPVLSLSHRPDSNQTLCPTFCMPKPQGKPTWITPSCFLRTVTWAKCKPI
ncbi:Transposon Tf2-6 polyprotein, partial [Clarias magur]